MSNREDVQNKLAQIEPEWIPDGYADALLDAADAHAYRDSLEAAKAAAEADLNNALAARDVAAAQRCSSRLLGLDLCVHLAPTPSVSPPLEKAVLDQAETVLRRAVHSDELRLVDVDYLTAMEQWRMLPSHVAANRNPPVFHPQDEAAVAEHQRAELEVRGVRESFGSLVIDRERPGVDVLALLVSATSLRREIARVAQCVAEANKVIIAANEARKSETVGASA